MKLKYEQLGIQSDDLIVKALPGSELPTLSDIPQLGRSWRLSWILLVDF